MNIWPRASVVGPLWNINFKWVLVFAIYIYVEYRVEYWSTKLLHKHIYMRNIVWHIQITYGVLKKSQNLIPRNHTYIYEEYRVAYQRFAKSWNIHHFGRLGVPKAETFSQFTTVPCLPKAYRNQANTSSLGIALWNICGISKSVLLRAFEALGAAVWRHAAAMLEAGLCSYFDLFLGAEGVA